MGSHSFIMELHVDCFILQVLVSRNTGIANAIILNFTRWYKLRLSRAILVTPFNNDDRMINVAASTM